MPSLVAHLITDPTAPVTVDFARKVHAELAKVPSHLRRARRDELASLPDTEKPAKPRATPTVGKGEVNPDLAAWWNGANDGTTAVTAVIRLAARTFPDMDRAAFVVTLVRLGVHPSTASIQFKKGRDGL